MQTTEFTILNIQLGLVIPAIPRGKVNIIKPPVNTPETVMKLTV